MEMAKYEPYHYRNDELTAKVQAEEKYINFNKWCKENGVIAPDCEYPVVFGDGLIGVGAKRHLGSLKAYIYIPNKMLITEELVRNSEIGYILAENEELFTDHANSEYFILIAFIIFEKLKGGKSFWQPYFDIATPSDLPYKWSQDEIDSLED